MSIGMTINITDVEDAITLGDESFIEGVFDFASKIISKGGTIVVQREYVNTSPDVLMKVTKQEQLDNWRSNIKGLTEKF